MFYRHDWLQQQINAIVEMLAFILFSKKSSAIWDSAETTRINNIQSEIDKLLAEGNINEAEEYLFDNYKPDKEHLKVAIDFYTTINNYSDEELENLNFSRSEIKDGLSDVMEIYGLEVLI